MMFCRLYYLCIAIIDIIVLQYTGSLSLSFLRVQCTATNMLKLHLKTWQIVVGLTLSVPIHSQWNASFVLLFWLSILIGGFNPPKTYQLSVSWITLIGLKYVEFQKNNANSMSHIGFIFCTKNVYIIRFIPVVVLLFAMPPIYLVLWSLEISSN